MSSNEIIVDVRNISKSYFIYEKPSHRFLKPLMGILKNSFFIPRSIQKIFESRFLQYGKEFSALKDISFSIKKAESFGIIGKNGAGKSTLLQIITGILNPTSGTISVKGRVAALLELGAGFNPEFTGRENIFMNASILGFTETQTQEKLEEIIDFSEIRPFIDQPVKTYSSGMYVRLAFSVQACFDPDILIIDEALSVGDIFFQQKCHARMEELEKNGTTLLFVSHDLASIEKYCKKVIFLKNGKIEFIGGAKEATNRFYYGETEINQKKLEDNIKIEELPIQKKNIFSNEKLIGLNISASKLIEYSQGARLSFFSIFDRHGEEKLFFSMNEWVTLYFEFSISEDIDVPLVGVEITNAKNITVYSKSSLSFYPKLRFNNTGRKNTILKVKYNLKLSILPGEYTISIGLSSLPEKILSKIIDENKVKLENHSKYIKNIVSYKFSGLFLEYPKNENQEFPFYGLVGLPDRIRIESN